MAHGHNLYHWPQSTFLGYVRGRRRGSKRAIRGKNMTSPIKSRQRRYLSDIDHIDGWLDGTWSKLTLLTTKKPFQICTRL